MIVNKYLSPSSPDNESEIFSICVVDFGKDFNPWLLVEQCNEDECKQNR